MDDSFFANESLYRAVRPASCFWRSDGTVSSAAFIDANGLSVDRGDFRQDDVVIADVTKRLNGSVVKFDVADCIDAEARVQYDPTEENRYHSLVLGKDKIKLSKHQARQLSIKCKIIFKETA